MVVSYVNTRVISVGRGIRVQNSKASVCSTRQNSSNSRFLCIEGQQLVRENEPPNPFHLEVDIYHPSSTSQEKKNK